MENQRTKRILVSCAVIIVVSCICVGLILGMGVGVSVIWPFTFGDSSTTPSSVSTTELPFATDEGDDSLHENGSSYETPDAIPEELPEELVEQLNIIESQVTKIRGLEAKYSVERTLISSADLQKIVEEDFFSDYTPEDSKQDVLILSTLGLLPDDFDLLNFYKSMYGEQIAGFYDDEIKKIFVVKGTDFSGSEKMTYAHEFTHVLQDQIYDLADGLGLNQEECEADSEKCAAVQALTEGDATKTELLWFQEYASAKDYLDLLKFYDSLETPILDTAPAYMASNLYFPYDKGLAFVEYFYDRGGYDEVDEVYLNPPVSTEQILHPERYPDDIPIVVYLPAFEELLGDGWTLLEQNVMGEWYTYLILSNAYLEKNQISDEKALKAAEGWGGDAYAFYLNEVKDEIVFILDTVWDTTEDAETFVDVFYEYANQRWAPLSVTLADARVYHGEDEIAAFWHDHNRTLWVIAPNQDILSEIILELQ